MEQQIKFSKIIVQCLALYGMKMDFTGLSVPSLTLLAGAEECPALLKHFSSRKVKEHYQLTADICIRESQNLLNL